MKCISFLLFNKNLRWSSLFLAVFSLLGISSCQWGDQEIALNKPDQDEFSIIYTDTASVRLSTIYIDSLSTLGTRLLAGKYTDSYLGKVFAESYFQTGLAQGFEPETRSIFDSLVLTLKYEYSYADTTKLQTLKVHKLTQDLSKASLYNKNKASYEPTAIGTASFRARPLQGRRLTIRLSDAFGEEILELAKKKALATSTSDWLKFLPGLALVSGANDNAAILGFSRDSVAMELHYHTSEVDGKQGKKATFGPGGVSFNHIDADRKGTNLPQRISSRESVSSTITGNASFIQSGTGLFTRIEFPWLRGFKNEIPGRIRINRAALRIIPIRKPSDNILIPQTGLSLSLVNRLNQQIGPIINGNSAATATYRVNMLDNTRYYEFDLSQYVSEIMNPLAPGNSMVRSVLDNGEGIVISPSSELGNSLARVAIGDMKQSDYTIRLEIYYTHALIPGQ